MENNQRFGNWTVIGDGTKPRHWLCRCDCGRVREVFSSSITTGKSLSCGCQRGKASIKHHLTSKENGDHPLYKVWSGIRARCHNPHRPGWAYYGGRGITICPEWDDAGVFAQWAMENGWEPGLTIDRIDPDGNYEPSNCRWIPMPEQGKNKTNTLWIEAFGERKTFSDWTRDPRCAVNRATFWLRVKRGIPAEEAMIDPTYNVGKPRKR